MSQNEYFVFCICGSRYVCLHAKPKTEQNKYIFRIDKLNDTSVQTWKQIAENSVIYYRTT